MRNGRPGGGTCLRQAQSPRGGAESSAAVCSHEVQLQQVARFCGWEPNSEGLLTTVAAGRSVSTDFCHHLNASLGAAHHMLLPQFGGVLPYLGRGSGSSLVWHHG